MPAESGGAVAARAVRGAAGRIRAVAIDLDGTLLDTVGELAEGVNAMLARLGRASATSAPGEGQLALRVTRLPNTAVRDMIGKGMAKLVERALAAATGEEPDAALSARALGIYQECYYALLGTSARPYPGVIEGLERLRGLGLPLAVVTNKASRFTTRLLETSGLAPWFDHVVSGDTYERKKPDPLPLARTAERFGCTTAELLMIGDSVNDVAAARAAGCPVLCVPYGYNEGRPVDELDFDGMIADLSEARDWIIGQANATVATT